MPCEDEVQALSKSLGMRKMPSWAEEVDDFSEDESDSPRVEQQRAYSKGKRCQTAKIESVEPLGSESSSPNSTCHSTCGSLEELTERNFSTMDSASGYSDDLKDHQEPSPRVEQEQQEMEPLSPMTPCSPSAMLVPVCEVGADSDNSQPVLQAVQCIPVVIMSSDSMWPSMSPTSGSAAGDTAGEQSPSICVSPHSLWPMDPQQTWASPTAFAIASDASPEAAESGKSMYQGCQGFVVHSWQPYQGVCQPPDLWLGTVTVMMRNLPNKYSHDMLYEEINDAGFSGYFDFMYLPIDNETKRNKGYAFINFVDSVSSWSFKCYYEGRRMSRFNSEKCVTVVPATIQGFETNHALKRTMEGPQFLNARAAQTASPMAEGQKQRRRAGRRRSLIDESWEAQQNKKAEAEGGAERKNADSNEENKEDIEETSKDDQTKSMAFERKFCPFCGKRIEPEFIFCQFCGGCLA